MPTAGRSRVRSRDVHVVALLQAEPGAEAELAAALRTTIAATPLEPGRHTDALHVSTRDPAQLVTVDPGD